MPTSERGQPLTAYTQHLIRRAFYRQFQAHLPVEEAVHFHPAEIRAELVLVKDDRLAESEYYQVPYQPDGDNYIFAEREAWEVAAGTIPLAESKGQARKRFVERLDNALALTEAEASSHPDGPWHRP